MKIRIASILLFVAIMAVSVSACNNQSKQNKKQRESSSSTQTVGKVSHITKSEFLTKIFDYEKNKEWHFIGQRPCIVDFYATWCGPCRRVAPILDELSAEYSGIIDIYKVDVDKEKELAAAFGVSSIPTLLFVPMQGNPYIISGALDKSQFIEAINQYVLKNK